jgi:hypothetical protein
MGLLARAVIAIVIGIVVWLVCGFVGLEFAHNAKAGFAVDFGRFLVTNANLLGFLAALAYFFIGFVSTNRLFRPVP